MQGVKVMGFAALAIRFVVELLGIAAVAYWGWQTGPEGIGRVVLAVSAAVVLIVVWALVVAPKADNPLSQQVRDIIGTVLLLVAAGGVAAAGEPTLAMVFAAVIVIDWLAMVVIGPDASQALRSSTASRR
jgi:Protein of unknown function (DUF2568)